MAALHQVKLGMLSKDQSLSSEAIGTELDSAAYLTLTDALMESGAGWTRVYIEWSRIEPITPTDGQPPQYTWTWFDSKLRPISEIGVRVIGTVAKWPGWAASSPCAPI